MTSLFLEILRSRRDYLIGATIGLFLTTATVLVLSLISSKPNLKGEPIRTEFSSVRVARENREESISYASGQTDFASLLELLDSSAHGGFALSAALHTRVSRLDVDELTGLLEQSRQITDAGVRIQLQALIGRKLVTVDPDLAMSQIGALPPEQQGSLVVGIFHEWAYLDLDSAIESAKELAGVNRLRAIESIMNVRSDLSNNARYNIANELGAQFESSVMAGQKLAARSVDDPELVWELLVADNTNDLYQLEELIRVSELWVAKDGMEILPRLFRDQDNRLSQDVFGHVVAAISAFNPTEAFDFIRGLSQNDRYWLIPVLVKWAESDPHSAISALSKFELDLRSTLIRNRFIYAWANRDPFDTLKHIDLFPKRMQHIVASSVIGSIAKTSPQQAVKLLEDLGEIIEDTSGIEHDMMRLWAGLDPKEALQWVLDDSRKDHPRRTEMLEAVIRALAEVDPKLAFEVALDGPTRRFGGGMELDVMSALSDAEGVELAIELLPRVRQENQSRAFSVVARGLVEGGQVKRALSLGERLPEESRAAFYASVASNWADSNPLEMLEELAQLPEEFRSRMALQLARANKHNPVLSEAQLEQVKTHLDESDAERVEFWESL